MILWDKIKKNNALLQFFAGLCFILCAVIIQNYFNRQNDPQKIKENFVHVLQEKEMILADHLQKLKTNYSTLADSLKISFNRKLQNLYEEESISFLIYDHDSLVFWSTNTIPVSGNFFPEKIQ